MKNRTRVYYMNHERWLYLTMRRNERRYARELRILRTGRGYSEPRWAADAFCSADFYRNLLIESLAHARALRECRP